MAGPDTQEHPARRELVDTRDRMRSDGCNPRTRNCDAGAQLDSLRVGRGECERRVAVRPDHLRVRNPATVIAKFLAVAREIPFIDMRIDANSKFHRDDLGRDFRRMRGRETGPPACGQDADRVSFIDSRTSALTPNPSVLTIGRMTFSIKNSSWRRPRG